MEWELALFVFSGILAFLLLLGAPIGVSLGLTGLIGITLKGGTHLWISTGDILWNNADSFTLVAIPLFVLMGEIILRTGVSPRFYRTLATLLSPFPGGLIHANIAGCAIFSAFSGSSVATALTMGTVAIPEMEQRGYECSISAGSLAAGGCLGILIPPSIPLIIYGAMVKESVVTLFIAGIVPGIILSLLFIGYIGVRVWFTPALAPADQKISIVSGTILQAIKDSWAVTLLIFSIVGGMYFGIVTPTEAAAFGCTVAILIGLWYREMSWKRFWSAIQNAVTTTCVVMFIIINGMILSFAIVDAGIARGIANMLVESNLASWQFFALLFVVYLVLGMFVEGITMMLLTVPVIYTSVLAFGFDGIWFGVILVIFIELAALTPPMGLNLFAIQSVSGGWAMSDVVRGSAPFALIIALFVFLLYLFPNIVLWLPKTMEGSQKEAAVVVSQNVVNQGFVGYAGDGSETSRHLIGVEQPSIDIGAVDVCNPGGIVEYGISPSAFVIKGMQTTEAESIHTILSKSTSLPPSTKQVSSQGGGVSLKRVGWRIQPLHHDTICRVCIRLCSGRMINMADFYSCHHISYAADTG